MNIDEPSRTSAGVRAALDGAARDAYRLAVFLAARFGADTIVEIGGRSRGCHELPGALAATAVDLGPDVDQRRQLLSSGRWIIFDSGARNSVEPSTELLSQSIVVCANVLELLPDPRLLIRRLARMSQLALATIITTPERAIVSGNSGGSQLNTAATHGWSLSAFTQLLKQHGVEATFSGLTLRDHEGNQRNIIVVADHCPVDAGRAAPPEFRPLALMATYNDLDIAPQVVTRLLDDGLDVHVRDNWSSDGTFEQLSAIGAATRGLSVERFPDQGPILYHDYLGLLEWKEQIAARHPGRWIASVDSDEIRSSPWADVSFRGGLYLCERMGFTAVDLTVLNFRPVADGFKAGLDPERWFRYFEFGRMSPHFHQIKTWRQGSERVDLRESGGHEARFDGRRIFPYKFVLKHYPLRSTVQARRKIFTDRKPRYSPVTRSRGWHIQYDHFSREDSFLREPSTLIEFDDNRTRSEHVIELISGIGLVRAAVENLTSMDTVGTHNARSVLPSG